MLLWWMAMALAQSDVAVPDVNAQLYRPPVDAQRTLWTESSGSVTPRLDVAPRLALHYAWRPLVYVIDTPVERSGEVVRLVSDVLQANAIARVAFDRVRLAVDVPIYLYQAGDLTTNGAGLGDLAFDGRVTVLDTDDAPLGLGFHARVSVPSSTVDAPLGSSGLGGELWASATHHVGERITLAGNLGVAVSPRQDLQNVLIDDALVFRAGGAYLLSPEGGISVDLAGQTGLSGPGVSAGTPVEGLLGGWVQASQNVAIRAGVGRGLTSGVGAPLLRTVAMVAFQPRPATDRDLDGVVDRYDQCPDEPEDADGYQDEDGCPELDDDADGILDVADSCPRDPEDMDGFRDADGCPDPSQGVVIQVQTAEGRVISDAMTTLEGEQSGLQGSGFWLAELHEGAYVVTGFADGFMPTVTRFEVPYDAEKVVVVLQPQAVTGTLTMRVRTAEGGAADASWQIDGLQGAPLFQGGVKARLAPGVHDIVVSMEGHATQWHTVEVPADGNVDLLVRLESQRVRISETQIDVEGTVFFDTGSATIQASSFSLLDEVAEVLRAHPELTRVRVEGHTDARGSASSNLRLSESRAQSVMTYLTQRGVASQRLVAVGLGETQPLVNDNTPAAWERNRRVDFFVETRSESPR